MASGEDKKRSCLAIACGGTGGHFYPGLSIAKAFREAGGDVVMYIGGHHQDAQLKVCRENNFRALPSKAICLPRTPVQAILFPFRFLSCIWSNYRSLKKEHATVALCMGSFASVPMGLATVLLRIPLAVHEGNAVMGQANRFLGRFAKLQALSFPLQSDVSSKAQQELVGMPIRKEIINAISMTDNEAERESILADLELDSNRKTILVFGGSQGAQAINEAIEQLVGELVDEKDRIQLIHLTGKDDNENLLSHYENHGIKALVKKSDPNIQYLYIAADFVICRAGASTLYELAALGKAPLMIPYPGAKDQH